MDRSAGEVLILDPQAHRLVRLAGPAALAPGRDDVRAHLAALGLVDATGEGAALLGASRREVLTAGAAAALGITVLALPGAASAASTDPAGSTVSSVGDGRIDLILARATTDMGAGMGYLTGSRDRDAAVRTVNLGTGALGATLEKIGPAVPMGAGTYPRDIVRVGSRAYIVYVVTTLESHLSILFSDFIPAGEHIVGSGVIEVALDADSVSGMEVVRTVSVDVLFGGSGDGETAPAPLRWAMITCAATDGTDVYVAGVADFGTEAEPALSAGLVRLTIPSDPSVPLTSQSGVTLSPTDAQAPPFEVPLAMVVAGGAIYVHVQLHPALVPLDGVAGVRPDGDVSPGGIVRVPLGELDPSNGGVPGGTIGVRLIGEGLNFPAIFGGLFPQPLPVVFAGNLYVVDQVATRDDFDNILWFHQRISRFSLAGDWGSLSDPGPAAGPDQVLVLERYVDDDTAEPSPDPASSLLRVGSTLLLGSLLAIRRVIIGDGGVMTLPDDAAARRLDLIPTFLQIFESDPESDELVVIGVGPALPATNPLRAFFGLGKGKGVLIEVLV